MKVVFLTVGTKSPPWLLAAKELYIKKISGFCPCEEMEIKSPQIARESQALKLKKEEEKILNKISPQDFVIIFDEKGQAYSSVEFSSQLQKKIETTSPQRLIFLIGGAFGFSDFVRSKAHWRVSLSPMTMNHWVAQIMSMEQVYRAFSIHRGLPYHN